jgi:hypothetical protein
MRNPRRATFPGGLAITETPSAVLDAGGKLAERYLGVALLKLDELRVPL